MSCNCKKSPVDIKTLTESNGKISINIQTVFTYTLKIIGFFIMVLMLPILNIYIVWLMFRTLILNKNVDLKPLLFSIGSKFMEKEKEDDEEEFLGNEFDNLTEDDVVLLDSEDITNREKK